VGETEKLRHPSSSSLRARYTAALVVAVAISVSGFGFLATRQLHHVHHVHHGSSSPTSATPSASDRSTCAALQDAVDDLRAKAGLDAVQADVSKAGDAANRGGDPALTANVRAVGSRWAATAATASPRRAHGHPSSTR
jgi:hypothetical protein